jgi:hypothetical protein
MRFGCDMVLTTLPQLSAVRPNEKRTVKGGVLIPLFYLAGLSCSFAKTFTRQAFLFKLTPKTPF